MTRQEMYSVKEYRKNVEAYSSAIDESTDVTDNAQLAVFILDVDEDFQLVDEPLELVSLKEKQILVTFFSQFVTVLNKSELLREKNGLVC
jgi:hypothetical protein